MSAGRRAGAPAPLFLVSASILLLEIYWLRALAEAEWGHLASMVVSTAMLGIGAGGTLVAVAGVEIPEHRAWTALLIAHTLLAGVAPLFVRAIPFEPLLLMWQAPSWGWLILRELVIAASFAAGAGAVALAFRARADSPGRLYALNLLGSTAGVGLALLLMAGRPTADLNLAAVGCAGLAAVGAIQDRRARVFSCVVAIAWTIVASRWSAPIMDETKDLALALRLPKATVLADLPGVAGRWTLLESPALHFAPGLSLVHSEPLPPQRALFVRGDGRGALYQAGGTEALRHRAAWLPYEIRPPSSVLVLGGGAGLELEAARLAGAERVVAVVPDSRTRVALAGDLGRFGGLSGAIELRGSGERAALAELGENERYDLLVLPPEDSLDSATAGLAAGLESYALTVEAIAAALEATTENGQIAFQRWTQAPPRDLPKLVATLVQVFAALGIRDIRSHLSLLGHWDAWTLCASRRPYGDAERTRLRKFASENGFDVLLPESGGGFLLHELPGPPIAPLLNEIVARGDGSVPEDYPFYISPATDERPYFHRTLSFRHLASYLEAVHEGSVPFGEWGDLFLWAKLASAILLGAVLIAAPVLLSSRRPRAALEPTLLFACLGFGYMLIEVLFIHHGTRLLGDPSLTTTVVLMAFLLGSGIGAAWLSRLGERGVPGPVAALVAALAAVAAGSALEPLLAAGIAVPAALRWIFLFAPALIVAIPLGMPFPAGLARTRERPERIPWLIAVNGWASVVGAVLATLLAMTLGFRGLALTAASLYAAASILLARARV